MTLSEKRLKEIELLALASLNVTPDYRDAAGQAVIDLLDERYETLAHIAHLEAPVGEEYLTDIEREAVGELRCYPSEINTTLANLIRRLQSAATQAQTEVKVLAEWKDAVLGRIKAFPEWEPGEWGGDKDGWGFNFEFLNWVQRDRSALKKENETLKIAATQARGEALELEDGELLPCPFCGGEAVRHDFDDEDDDNFGGAIIVCKSCQACTAVHFDRKENLDSSWNERALHPLPPKAPG